MPKINRKKRFYKSIDFTISLFKCSNVLPATQFREKVSKLSNPLLWSFNFSLILMWYFSGTLNKQCGYIDEKVARTTLEDVLGMGFFLIERTGDCGTARHYGKNLLTFGNFLKSLRRFFPRHRNNTAIIIIMELVEQIKYNQGIYIRGLSITRR